MILPLLILITLLTICTFAQGQTQTPVASFKTAMELRMQIGVNGVQAITNGQSTLNDGKAAVYVYSDTANMAEDSLFVLKNPNVSGAGRWIRVLFGNSTIKGLTDSLNNLRTYTQNIGKTLLYNKAGLVSIVSKRFTDTFSVSSATPTINLASYLTAMGCSNFALTAATGFRSGATASNAPNVAVSSISANSVSLVFSQQNTATVSILGINVLSGLPMVLTPDPTNVKAVLSFDAW